MVGSVSSGEGAAEGEARPGASTAKGPQSGWTLQHAASALELTWYCQLLLRREARPNDRDKSARALTPLHWNQDIALS